MQIAAVEIRQFHELLLMQHGNPPALKIYDPVLPQLPYHAVGMNGGDAQSLTDLLLGERHLKTVAVYPADHLQALAQLDHNMGEPCRRRTLADIDDPFPKYGGVDQRVAPKHLSDVGLPAMQLPQRLVFDEAERARCQGGEIMVHNGQEKAHEIRDFARNVNGENLPLAVRD